MAHNSNPIPDRITISAGGVVVNPQGMVLVVNQRGSSWSLPKGHLEEDEDALEAAQREIKEEAGITHLRFIKPLGVYSRYKIGKDLKDDLSECKIMVFFLFGTEQMELNPQDTNHPEARWVKPDQVESFLTHPKDKAFYIRIQPQIR